MSAAEIERQQLRAGQQPISSKRGADSLPSPGSSQIKASHPAGLDLIPDAPASNIGKKQLSAVNEDAPPLPTQSTGASDSEPDQVQAAGSAHEEESECNMAPLQSLNTQELAYAADESVSSGVSPAASDVSDGKENSIPIALVDCEVRSVQQMQRCARHAGYAGWL